MINNHSKALPACDNMGDKLDSPFPYFWDSSTNN